MKLGFIGLGHLGTPIAENILAAGHTLYVYNRTGSKTAPLAAKGAVACRNHWQRWQRMQHRIQHRGR